MRKLLFLIAPLLLCGSAWAVVPVNSCNGSATGSVNCNIASLGANHMVAVFVQTNHHPDLTYTDTLGNSDAAHADCSVGGTACAGTHAVYYRQYCFLSLNGLAMFAISSGASTGSHTFTVTNSASEVMKLFVAEYGSDLTSVEQVQSIGSSGGTFNVTTTGSDDLITVAGGDCVNPGATWSSAASGFTMEYTSGLFAVSDQIDVPAATYNVSMSQAATYAPRQVAAVFGVTGTPPPPPTPPPPVTGDFAYVRGVWVFDQGSTGGGGTTGGGGVTTPLSVTTVSPLPNAAQNSPYQVQLMATGGITPYSWAISSGSLPAGLTLNGGQTFGAFAIENSSTNWGACLTVACAGGAVDATSQNQTFGATSVLSMTGPPNSNALFFNKIASSAANAADHFVLDFKTTLDANCGTAQTFEYEPFQSISGRVYMFGHQCNQSTGFWQIWDELSQTWSNTSVVCSLSCSTQHHIQIATHRVPGSNLMYYDTLTIDGVVNAINTTKNSGLRSGFGDAIGANFQMDEGASGTSLSETIEEVSYSAILPGTGVISGTPTTAGTSAFTVQVQDSVAATATRSLSLTILAPAPKTVQLTWNASEPAGTTFNVKRSTFNGGPYTTIATGIIGTSYNDANVTSGVTYYYVSSAVGSNGSETPNSNQAFVTIP